ncbi:MAG: PBECR2 nuclease fold domain-containing protein [Eubacterium sp.]
MVEQFDRLSKYSLDPDNKKVYAVRKEQWENEVANGQKNDILNNTNDEGVLDVHSIGKINKEIYRCITEDILTDEVVITNNQIQHIMDRHPNDYERFSSYFGEIVKNPDYIIEANKPNTALLLKEIRENGEVFKTVLRLVTSKDNPNYKNSIITFMKIDEKEWNRLLRNKTILYKKE